MGEGFYRWDELKLPVGVEQALPAVVRVHTRIHLLVHVYVTDEQVKEARARAGSHTPRYLPGGGVMWPTHLSAADLLKLRADPLAAIQPGRFELLEATKELDPHHLPEPVQVESAVLGRGATGFLLGFKADRAVIATNYHLAREAIGRSGRENGVYTWQPVPTQDIHLSLQSGSRVEDVELAANASFKDWQAGNDWALLTAPATAFAGLQGVLLAAEPRPGEAVWGAGFPVRSARSHTPGYANADGTLRVTRGVLLGAEPEGPGWQAELDGLSGSSGSPVMNAQGEVIGIFRNHTHYHYPDTGPIDRRFMEYGGQAQLAPTDTIRNMLTEVGVTRLPR